MAQGGQFHLAEGGQFAWIFQCGTKNLPVQIENWETLNFLKNVPSKTPPVSGKGLISVLFYDVN